MKWAGMIGGLLGIASGVFVVMFEIKLRRTRSWIEAEKAKRR